MKKKKLLVNKAYFLVLCVFLCTAQFILPLSRPAYADEEDEDKCCRGNQRQKPGVLVENPPCRPLVLHIYQVEETRDDGLVPAKFAELVDDYLGDLIQRKGRNDDYERPAPWADASFCRCVWSICHNYLPCFS